MANGKGKVEGIVKQATPIQTSPTIKPIIIKNPEMSIRGMADKKLNEIGNTSSQNADNRGKSENK